MKNIILIVYLVAISMSTFAAKITEDELKLGAQGSVLNKDLYFGDSIILRGNDSLNRLEFSDNGVDFVVPMDLNRAQSVGGVKTFTDLPIFSSGIDVNAASTVDGTLDITGNTSVTGAMGVVGDTTLTGDLTVVSTTDGSQPCPTMTQAQIDALTPTEGECVYNSDTGQLNVYANGVFGAVGS